MNLHLMWKSTYNIWYSVMVSSFHGFFTKWLLSSVIPFMNLHLMWKSSCNIWCTSMVDCLFASWILWYYFKTLWEALATLYEIELLLSSVIPFMNLHLMWNSSYHICCTSMVVSFKDPLMVLQVSWSWEALATLNALEWLLSIVIPFMNCAVENYLWLQWLFPSSILWWYF